MHSKLLKIGIVVVVVLLTIYIGLDLFLGSFVKDGITRIGPRMTQTSVELSEAHISPITGSGTLTGLSVGNPKGWASDRAFYLGKIHVAVAPFSIFGDHIVIREIDIDDPEFVYETKFVSSNIGELLKNINAGTSHDPANQATTKSGTPIRFEVQHFVMRNGRVTVGVGTAAVTLPMPPVEVTDLGTKEGGITSDQLALAIMRNLTSSVVSATTRAATKIGSTMGAAAGTAVKDASANLKGLFGGSKN